MILGHTIKDYKRENLLHDVITGIIIMAVSIPISMGYSQIAGLPAVYGLYGSVFPIILFALFSTSPQFIFGVDAAPAALVGSALLGMNIQSGSQEALAVVPVITFFVALWLLAFYLMHAGKLVNYISAPVMGGFITGICSTIILMQVPKLMGGTAGTGELLELLEHIEKTAEQIKMKLIAAVPKEETITVTGRDLLKGLPREVTVRSTEIIPLVIDIFEKLANDIRSLLEHTPPEISHEILHNGIYLTGGTSQIEGMDRYLANQIKIRVNAAQNAQKTAAEGIGYLAEHPKLALKYAVPLDKKDNE